MERKNQISVLQMVTVVLICKLYHLLTYTPTQGSYPSGLSAFLVPFISAILTFILILPAFYLHQKYPQLNVAQCLGNQVPVYAAAIVWGYRLFALLAAGYTIVSFNMFLTSTILPQAGLFFLTITQLIAAIYCATLGLESICRFSFIIIVLFALMLGYIIFGTIPYFHFSSVVNQQSVGFISSVIGATLRNVDTIILILLFPNVKGNIKKGSIWYLGIFAVISDFCIVLLWGVLGGLAAHQQFPFYTLTSVAKVSLLERMDAVHIALWTCFALIRTSVYLWIAGRNFHWKQQKQDQMIIIGCSVILLLVGFVCSINQSMFDLLQTIVSSGITVLLFLSVIPLSVLWIRRKS